MQKEYIDQLVENFTEFCVARAKEMMSDMPGDYASYVSASSVLEDAIKIEVECGMLDEYIDEITSVIRDEFTQAVLRSKVLVRDITVDSEGFVDASTSIVK